MEQGHCTARGRHARDVRGLGYVARVYGHVLEDVRMPEEAVKPQGILIRSHGLVADEVLTSRKAHGLRIHAAESGFRAHSMHFARVLLSNSVTSADWLCVVIWKDAALAVSPSISGG